MSNVRFQYLNHFDLGSFEFYSNEMVFNHVYESFLKVKKDLKRSKYSMRMKIFSEMMKKRNNTQRLKIKQFIRWDERKNQDTCFIHALKSITNHMNHIKYFDLFKMLEVKEQIRLANFFLKRHGKFLSLKNCVEDNVQKYVKKCKDACLLIFWEEGDDVHTEAVKDGKFVNELDPKIELMSKKTCKIREFRYCDYVKRFEITLD